MLRGVRCFEDAEVELDPRITVIIGENGAGKTTIAEAMASLVHGDDEGLRAFPLRHGRERGSIELRDDAVGKRAAWWTREASGEERRRLPDSMLVLAYGRYRRVEIPADVQALPGGLVVLGPEWSEEYTRARIKDDLTAIVRRRRTATLSRPDNHLLRDLGDYLLFLHEHRGDPVMDVTWDRLSKSLRELGEGLEGIEVIEREDRLVPVLRRRGLPLELRELSDGYQAILVIVFDLILRLMQSFPLLSDPLTGPATVIIDEVDLHLHPRWQRAVVGQLGRLFSNAQFVLTTHSPAVIQGAIDHGHRVVTLEEREGATRVVAPEVEDLRGAQIGSVLVDERLFGVASRYSRLVEQVEIRVRRLRKKVQKDTATVAEREELLEALDKLQELYAAEDERRGDQPLLSEVAKVQVALLKKLERSLKKT